MWRGSNGVIAAPVDAIGRRATLCDERRAATERLLKQAGADQLNNSPARTASQSQQPQLCERLQLVTPLLILVFIFILISLFVLFDRVIYQK